VIDEIAIESGTFVFRTNPARLFVAAPFLRRLTLGSPDVTPAQLATIPQMRQIDWLYLECGHGTLDDFLAFAASPHFSSLRHLSIYGYGIGPEVAGILAGARWMPNLRGLSLTENAVGDDGAEAIAESSYCANLEELELDRNGLTDRGLITLCHSAYLAKLKALELGDGALTATGIRALRGAPFAPVLRELDLTRCGLDAPAFAELAAGAFPALRALDVNGNRAGIAAFVALTGAPFFRSLEVFGAEDCDLGNEIVAALAGTGFLDLTDLALGDNRIDADGIAALVRSKAATKLRALRLPRNPLGTDGVIELAGSALPHLRELDLQGIRLGKEAVLALVKAPWRGQLTRLDISEDCVGERALDVITERFGENAVRLDVDEE
jgi:Ran GTPase-activating protein (RanGAP) involved in mRNA processing and transport